MVDVAFTTYTFPTSEVTATTKRTLPDRLGNNVKNVKDWGATGDGVTDDHARIQAAVDALWQSTDARRGTIYFPPGTYYVSAPISWNPVGGGEHNIRFVGTGNDAKITGNFSGGIIQRFYKIGSFGPGPGAGPVCIENLWLNQDGEYNDDFALLASNTTAGSHCIFITADSCVTIRNVKCTTKKHGIGLTNTQGLSIYNCHVVCTGTSSERWGICTAANGTISSCYVEGFTSGIQVTNIGGTTYGCTVVNNDVGWDGGTYGQAADGLGNQFLTNFAILSNYFENNGVGLGFSTHAGCGGGFIASNTVVGGPDADYGFKAQPESPHDTILMGNTFSGAFSVAAITTPAQTARSNMILLGTTATNSGAGVAWGEAQGNDLYNNIYINCNSTTLGPAGTFADLPNGSNANRYIGDTYNITNSNTAVWGATAAAGGSNHVKVRWNGTNWTVVGK